MTHGPKSMPVSMKKKKAAAKKPLEDEKVVGRGTKAKWKASFPLKVYRMVLAGLADADIAAALGVGRMSLNRWKNSKPELAEAYRLGREDCTTDEDFPRWVYKRLSPDLKKIWDEINKLWRSGTGHEKMEQILGDHGKVVRQQLFLHALCKSRFNPSMAMMRVSLSKKELDEWMKYDMGFAELVEQVQWHKGNYFEEKLMRLIQEGNPGAVMFANKTFNASRGYGRRDRNDKLEVSHSGTVLHGVVDLADVLEGLSENSKMEVLEALRRREKEDNASGRLLDHKTAPSVMTVEQREEVLLGKIAGVDKVPI